MPKLTLSLLMSLALVCAAGPDAARGDYEGHEAPEELLFEEIPMVMVAAAPPGGAAPAATVPDHSAPERLLFDEIPFVISATRTERPRTDVPNSVRVITAEEIRASGATNLEDVLKTLAGVDVMRITNSDLAVSVRGFNAPANSNLLVMVDGRSVYLDFFGNVLWDQLPVPLQEIDRIEVIRGPGSVLYGANALLGTINIITKSPEDLPTAYARTAVGQRTTLETATAAHHTERVSIKASAQYEARDAFRNDVNPAPNTQRDRDDTALRSRYTNAALYLRPTDDLEVRLSGGIQRFFGDLLVSTTTVDGGGHTGWAQLNVDRGPWSVQAFYSRFSSRNGEALQLPPFPAIPGEFSLLSTTMDLDLQRTASLGDHEIVVGGNVRRVSTDSDVVLGSREEDMTYGGFVNDEFPISDRLRGFLGLRIDRQSKVGWQTSPRLGLVYRLGETERLRLSVARAFRNPTQIFSYIDQTVVPGVPSLTINGNDELDPIRITAYELGLEGRPHPKLHGDLSLFYNVLEEFPSSFFQSPPPAVVLSFRNRGRTNAWGGEVSLDWSWAQALQAFASYSVQSAHGPLEGSTPRQKASAGLRGSVGPLRYALTGAYVGHTEFDEGFTQTIPLIVGGTHPLDIPSRLTVDGFVGVRLRQGIEVGILGRNLFHQVRRQHPLGDEIGSEILFTLSGEF
jgi:iron complex outermembrane receptor protein